jgi:hypothetical protein
MIKGSAVYNLINEILHKYSIAIDLKDTDLVINENDRIIQWSKPAGEILGYNKVSEYLENNLFKSLNPSGETFYHYLPKFCYLKKILKTGKIRFYNLNKFLQSDKTEFRYLLEDLGINFPKFEEQVGNIKNNIFIWCLTKNINSRRHWKEYANNYQGVCIGMIFSILPQRDNRVAFVKVCYEIPFLREIQEQLEQRFHLTLSIRGYSHFAKFYKNKCFDWENEYRFAFDLSQKEIITNSEKHFFNYSNPNQNEIDSLFKISQDDGGLKYLEIPLKNTFFGVAITEVYYANDEQKFRAEKYQPDYGFKLLPIEH